MKKLLLLLLLPLTALAEYGEITIDYADKRPPPPPPPPPQYELVVNRSTYTMDIYVDDVFVETRRVIVGKAGRTTPLFETTFDQIEINPTWDVPRSLEDDLVTKFRAKEDMFGYIHRNGYYFVDKETDEEIAAEDIDWPRVDPHNTTFKIKQRPGNLNMLGRVMFVLDQNGVQMHGTANPELFESEVRRYSSGCIRIDGANDLAGMLLGKNDFLEYANSQGNKWHRLPAPVTVKVID